jgi:hypothetical protein
LRSIGLADIVASTFCCKVVNITNSLGCLYTRNFADIPFSLRLNLPQDLSADGRMRSVETSSDLDVNETEQHKIMRI